MENDRTISAMMRNLIKRLGLAAVALFLSCFFFGAQAIVVGIQTTECLTRSIFVTFCFGLQVAVVTFTCVDYRVGHR